MTKINRLTPPDNRMLPFSLEAVKNGKNLVTRIGVLVRDLHVLERRTKERYFKGQVLTVVSAPQIRTHTNDERDCTDESKLGILEHAVEWREDGTTTFATETNPYDMFVLKDKVNIADLPKAQKLVYDPRVDNSLENWIKDPKILEIYNVSNLYNPKHITQVQ